ncbi:uncharacterized protein LOC111021147 [Momordica charantia]|uniref:Uncharacterized protein LOC111021147 n=1 Tax=Momordica charantia TaxID=3673 RepID=A0A6J1DHJ4_MOMCH|nr:uncharacterized protein LOC111021147 [Momordica charantia]
MSTAVEADKFEKDNKTIRGHLLNHMNDFLFDLFVVQKSAKVIWDTLESRYGGDDAGRRKYVVGKWLQFQMSDDKPVMDQVHEYENLVASVLSEGMKMCEMLQANVFKNKGKTIVRDRAQKNKGLQPKNTGGRIEKSKLVCYVCEKPEHKSYQCTQKKDRIDQRATPQANLTETDDIITTVVVETNLVENKSDWILDTGASRHFCSNRDLFHDFQDSADGECVFMGNSATVGVLGKGKVLLKLTSGKTLSLSNVLYVPSLRRNLVSRGLLNRAGLRIVFKANKVIITKNGDFVGKGYLADGFFVLNTTSSNEINSSSAYIVESLDV